MENGTVPAEIADAIRHDRLRMVKAWLDTCGDVNANWNRNHDDPILNLAARHGHTRIMSLLLSKGADVDSSDADGRTALYRVLNHFGAHRSLPALRLLLSNGADVNLALHQTTGLAGMDPYRPSWAGRSPLVNAAGGGKVDCVRMLLRAGADTEYRAGDGYTAEEYARSCSMSSYIDERKLRCTESADLLRDVRLAGGWVRYALQPHYDLIVLRALCHRGRATCSGRTPELLVRLFGAPDGRPSNAARRDLPDPHFWRVLEFALGTAYDYPWVRQRVRARAAAAVAAAE